MESFEKAMQDAQEELARIEQRRAKLLQLVEDLKALSGDELAELAPPPGYEPEGLTAEIRKILGLTTVHLTAVQIRDSLVERGFSKANPKNLLIAVHTVLGRIEKELDVAEREGKSVYKANRPGFLLSSEFRETLEAMAKATNFNPAIANIARAMEMMQKPFEGLTEESPAYKSGMRGDEKPKKK